MIQQERLVNEFLELTSIDAPSLDERRMADCLKEKLAALGFTVTEDDAGKECGGSAGNVYGFLKGTLPGEPLLFSAHMDTVEPSRGKRAQVSPDGVITSSGDTVLGADDAAGLTEILEAVRHLSEERIPHRDIEVLCPISEEIYLRGSRLFDYGLLHAKEAYVLDLSGAPGRASRKEPTLTHFVLTVRGKAAHAGFEPEKGINAIAAAARAIAQIPQGRWDEETTVNIGKISGGKGDNIVSEYCTVSGEVRCFTHEKAEKTMERIVERFRASLQGAALDVHHETTLIAYETPRDHAVVRRFTDACRKLGLAGELTATFGGSDNNSFMRNGITGIVLSCGMNNVHSVEEYTTVSELTDGARLVAELMQG